MAMMASSVSCQTFSALDPAEQGAVVGGAVGKLIVDEGGGEQLFAFAAGNEKSEAGREGLADIATVAESYRDG
jgi:hypothetical protein